MLQATSGGDKLGLPAGLDRLFSPRSIAVVGASNNPASIGGWVFANLVRAFAGPLHPIHPRHALVQGHGAYPSIAVLPEPVDLAVVVVPAASVPAVIEECAANGVGGVVVITAGFAEIGPEGAAWQAQITRTARSSGVRVVGPNCIGFMNLFGGVMANFALHPTTPLPTAGPVAAGLSERGIRVLHHHEGSAGRLATGLVRQHRERIGRQYLYGCPLSRRAGRDERGDGLQRDLARPRVVYRHRLPGRRTRQADRAAQSRSLGSGGQGRHEPYRFSRRLGPGVGCGSPPIRGARGRNHGGDA